MKRAVLFLGAAFAFATPALSQDPPAAPVEAPSEKMAAVTAEEFVEMAAVSNMFEIQSSMMAKDAESAEVKAFAEQMIVDHTKAGEELAAAADSAPPEALDEKHQAMIDELATVKGAELDKKYVEMQVAAHEEAVMLFTTYAESGEEEDLKAFAAKTLPTLQMHFDHIKGIAAAPKG
jgi:putative membrane protein